MIKILFSILTFFIVFSGIYGFFIEPETIAVNNIRIPVSYQGLKGKTAIQLSDLHIENIGRFENKIISLVNNMKPDFIFLTGDYVKWNGNYKHAMDFISSLKAEYGIWAVLGDYDYSNSRKSCSFCHISGTGRPSDRHSVKFLRNTTDTADLTGDKIVIAGWDDYDDSKSLSGEKIDILLSHNPLVFDKIETAAATLILSGDTHGGQIPLPSFLWSLLGYEKNARYNHGLYKKGNKTMYVTRGLGTSHIHFRLFSRPEIAVIRFI